MLFQSIFLSYESKQDESLFSVLQKGGMPKYLKGMDIYDLLIEWYYFVAQIKCWRVQYPLNPILNYKIRASKG